MAPFDEEGAQGEAPGSDEPAAEPVAVDETETSEPEGGADDAEQEDDSESGDGGEGGTEGTEGGE